MTATRESLPVKDRRTRARKRALVVDDDVLARIETRLLLEMHGYQVDEVNDGLEAVGLVDVDAPELDLVVLDYEMALLNGMETIQSLRALQPGLRAILCVGNPEEGSDRTLPEGAAFMEKPCTLNGLSRALEQALGAGSVKHMVGGKVAQSHRIRLGGNPPHYPPR